MTMIFVASALADGGMSTPSCTDTTYYESCRMPQLQLKLRTVKINGRVQLIDSLTRHSADKRPPLPKDPKLTYRTYLPWSRFYQFAGAEALGDSLVAISLDYYFKEHLILRYDF